MDEWPSGVSVSAGKLTYNTWGQEVRGCVRAPSTGCSLPSGDLLNERVREGNTAWNKESLTFKVYIIRRLNI